MRSPAAALSSRRPGRWDLAAAAVVLGTLASHVGHIVRDSRTQRDPGGLYRDLPDFYFALGAWEGLPAALARAFAETSGWLNLGVAAWLRGVGRSVEALALWNVGWLGLILGAVALLGRRLAGPPGALAAVAAVAAVPAITVQARLPRVHVVETACVLWLVWAHARDPRLERWSTAIAVGGLGAMVLDLRGTGLLWMGTVALALAWGCRAAPPWRRLALVLGLWTLGGVPALGRLGEYVQGKLGARARYAASQLDLGEDVWTTYGPGALCLVAVGLPLLVRRVPRRHLPLVVLPGSWVAVALGVFAVMKAGLTNYLPFVPALVLLGAVGLVLRHPALALVPVALWGVQSWAWLPLPAPAPAPGEGHAPLVRPHRVWTGWGAADVAALLDASCRTDAWQGCHVVVVEGLFEPGADDPGELALFLLAEDRVGLWTVDDTPEAGWDATHVDALALFECGVASDAHHRRSPMARRRAAALALSKGLQEVYGAQVTPDCSFHWYTPGGGWASPALAPVPAVAAPTLDEHRLDALTLEFLARNPGFSNPNGRAALYTAHNPRRATPPPGWTAQAARAERLSQRPRRAD